MLGVEGGGQGGWARGCKGEGQMQRKGRGEGGAVRYAQGRSRRRQGRRGHGGSIVWGRQFSPRSLRSRPHLYLSSVMSMGRPSGMVAISSSCTMAPCRSGTDAASMTSAEPTSTSSVNSGYERGIRKTRGEGTEATRFAARAAQGHCLGQGLGTTHPQRAARALLLRCAIPKEPSSPTLPSGLRPNPQRVSDCLLASNSGTAAPRPCLFPSQKRTHQRPAAAGQSSCWPPR